MKLTTKGRYAVTAILDVALYGQEKPLALSQIAERRDISQAYLEQLFRRLREHGLVLSVRGVGGGYRLARSPELISVAEVIAATSEDVDVTRCSGAENCENGRRCLTHHLWERLNRTIDDFLAKVTLADLIKESEHQQVVWHK